MAALLLSSCATQPLPAWHGRIYQAQSRAIIDLDGTPHGGLVRRQAQEVVRSDDPTFDTFMAMTWQDFRAFTETFVFSCEKWDESAPISLDDIKRFLTTLKGPTP